MKWFLVSLVALSPITAWAMGQNVGNGGAVVQGTCDGQVPTEVTVELLDFFEGRYFFNLTRDLGPDVLTVDQKVELALHRLDRVDQARAALYRSWVKSFFAETKFQDARFPFPPLRDVGNIRPNLPQGCELNKIADQILPETDVGPFGYRYLIRRDAYDKLSSDNKAGLILHEIIYRDAISRGHLTSVKARNFTALIASNRMEQIALKDYQQFLVDFGLEGYMAPIPYYHQVLRYFDHKMLTKSEAANFCNNLRGDSRAPEGKVLKYFTDQQEPWRDTAINKHILKPDNTGDVIAWIDDGVVKWGNHDLEFGYHAQDRTNPFFCVQEMRESPWTKQD